jgi:hypothetical protein
VGRRQRAHVGLDKCACWGREAEGRQQESEFKKSTARGLGLVGVSSAVSSAQTMAVGDTVLAEAVAVAHSVLARTLREGEEPQTDGRVLNSCSRCGGPDGLWRRERSNLRFAFFFLFHVCSLVVILRTGQRRFFVSINSHSA